MKMRYIIAACGMVLGLSACGAQAAASLTPAQQSWVHKIESSLKATKSFQARFEQITEQNGTATGTVLLERPGRMRFSYDPPSPLLLIANEGKVVFQDRSIGQITTIPLEHTPLGLLLRPDPRFSGDVSILDYSQQGNEIRLRVTRTANPGEGEMTLYFSAQPLSLKGWTVLDAQGHKTIVHFANIRTGITIAPEQFTLPKEED